MYSNQLSCSIHIINEYWFEYSILSLGLVYMPRRRRRRRPCYLQLRAGDQLQRLRESYVITALSYGQISSNHNSIVR